MRAACKLHLNKLGEMLKAEENGHLLPLCQALQRRKLAGTAIRIGRRFLDC